MAAHQLRIEPQVGEVARLNEWVGALCTADGVPDDITFKLTLAIEEAVVNVISHGFEGLPPPHSITVRLELAARLIAAEITDNGRPFDPTAATDPDLTLPLEARHPGGLGIHLIRRMVDRLRYRRSDGRNILQLEKARS